MATGALGPARSAPRLREKAGGLAAAASAAVGLGGVGAALAMSGWFVWSEDALSDLGNPRHASAGVFGASLAASGLLYLVFVWGLAGVVPRTWQGTASLAALSGGGASLAAVGVVNESYGTAHIVVSFTYFALVPLGMALLAAAFRARFKRFAPATFAAAGAGALFGLLVLPSIHGQGPFSSQAVPELIASAVLAGWALGTGALLFRGRFTQ